MLPTSLFALLATAALCPVAGRLGQRLGLVDRLALTPSGAPVPRTAGWALVLVWLLLHPSPTRLNAVVIAAWLLGLHDDRFRSSAKLRAALLIVLAMLLAVPGQPLVAAAVGTLWVAAVVVAFDFIDGLDGLAVGLGAVVGVGLMALGGPGGSTLAGACVGIWLWNRPAARIHLGDNGSNALGLLVGGLTLPFVQLGQPMAAAALVVVPAVDLAVSLVRRFRSAGSPFHGDRLHLHHEAEARHGAPGALLRLLGTAAAGAALAMAPPLIALGGALALAASLLPLAVWSRDPDRTFP